MSKMGSTIVSCMDIVKNTATFAEAESQIRQRYGDMFVAIAEEYYQDMVEPSDVDYSENYDVEAYEAMLADLEREGVL